MGDGAGPGSSACSRLAARGGRVQAEINGTVPETSNSGLRLRVAQHLDLMESVGVGLDMDDLGVAV